MSRFSARLNCRVMTEAPAETGGRSSASGWESRPAGTSSGASHGGRHHLGACARVRRSSPGWSDNRRPAVRRWVGTARRPGPTSTSAIISNEVATGLNTKQAGNVHGVHIADYPLCAVRGPRLRFCAGSTWFFFFRVPRRGRGAAPVSAPARLILAPSLSRSVPSMTTVSPMDKPDRMAVFFPSLGPKLIFRTDTV